MVEFDTDSYMVGLSLYGWVWYLFSDGLTGTIWLGLVLVFPWLDWHCMVEFRTDFLMDGLAQYGWVWY
jgi:hypothetical protein